LVLFLAFLIGGSVLSNVYDVLIIGAGVAGISVGSGLVSRGIKKVMILEKEAVEGSGSTRCSAGGIRQQFDDEAKVRAAKFCCKVYESFEDRYGVDPEFLKHGYLLLRTDEQKAGMLKASVEKQRKMGLNTRFLDQKEIKELTPSLNTEDLKGAAFNGDDGYLDPHMVLQGFLKSFRRQGGVIEYNAGVKDLLIENNRIVGLSLSNREYRAGCVILAAGPHTGLLLKRAGIDLPMKTCRRQIFSTGPVNGLNRTTPLVIDEDAPFYFRPEGDGVIMSLAEIDEMPPPEIGNEIAISRKNLDLLAERAMHRCPLLSEAEIRTGWAGLRTITPDERPLLGPVPGIEGLFLAAGFSGHGITLAPFTSEYIANEVTDQPYEDTLRTPFAVSRFIK